MTWTERGFSLFSEDGSGSAIFGRVVNSDGSFASDIINISGTSNLNVSNSDTLPLSNGDALVYWNSDLGTSARVVAPDGTLVSEEYLLISSQDFILTDADTHATQLENGDVVIGRNNISVIFSPVGSQ